MNLITVIFALIASLMYGLINYYVGSKGYKSLERIFPFINPRVYWIIFWIIVFSFIISRIGSRYIPSRINHYLSIIGYYWMAAFEWFLIIIVIVNTIKLIAKHINPNFNEFLEANKYVPYIGPILILLVCIILIYGTINARNPIIKNYDIQIDKAPGKIQSLKIAFVSDIHIGQVVNSSRVSAMVNSINALMPDIVLLGGDTIDDDPSAYINEKMDAIFTRLRSKYGTYAVLGNHEYYSGKTDTIVNILNKGNINVLRDGAIKIDDSFYLVGREDAEANRFGIKRKTVAELTADFDKNLPIILLDHQPPRSKKSLDNVVDLQLSGHTHSGQYFPNSVMTSLIYDDDYGLLKYNNCSLLVTSGYGTWGPPIRMGNRAEIVLINISFRK